MVINKINDNSDIIMKSAHTTHNKVTAAELIATIMFKCFFT